MKGKRHSVEEKVRILRKADEGKATILEVCREANISEVTFHRWKRELGMLNLVHCLGPFYGIPDCHSTRTSFSRYAHTQTPNHADSLSKLWLHVHYLTE